MTICGTPQDRREASVQADGRPFAAEPFYRDQGAGQPAFVLVHGAMCDHSNWDALVPRLAALHRVVRLDLAGHGRSPGEEGDCSIEQWADQVIALIQRLGLGRVVLVGHSMGGRVVAEAAARAPECLAGLVLLDSSRWDGSGPPEGPPPGDGRSRFDVMIGPHADDAVQTAVRVSMARPTGKLFAAVGAQLLRWDTEAAPEAYARLAGALPVLVIQSTILDFREPRRSLRVGEDCGPFACFVRRMVPQAQIRLLPEAGHFNMMEQPAAVAGMILDFTGGSGSGRRPEQSGRTDGRNSLERE